VNLRKDHYRITKYKNGMSFWKKIADWKFILCAMYTKLIGGLELVLTYTTNSDVSIFDFESW
jgi:hypothetical protein